MMLNHTSQLDQGGCGYTNFKYASYGESWLARLYTVMMNTKVAGKRLLFVGLLIVVPAIVQAQSWQNDYHADLNVDCGNASALYKVRRLS